MQKISFIVTQTDDRYLDGLQKLFNSYSTISPEVRFIQNNTLSSLKGSINLLPLESNKVIKLSDSIWPCDEEVIKRIFSQLSYYKAPLGGTRKDETIATDLFFADTNYGNIFEHLDDTDPTPLETACNKTGGRFYEITERTFGKSCDPLGICSGGAGFNLNYLNKFLQEKPFKNILKNYITVSSFYGREHRLLPLILELTKEFDTLAEISDTVTNSTWALLAGRPKELTSCRLDGTWEQAQTDLSEGAGILHNQRTDLLLHNSVEALLINLKGYGSIERFLEPLSKMVSKRILVVGAGDSIVKEIIDKFANEEWKVSAEIDVNSGLTILEKA